MCSSPWSARSRTRCQSATCWRSSPQQRRPRGDGRVVRLSDGESGVSARTIKRRLSSVSGLFGFLLLPGEMAANPVPRGLPTRRERQRPRQGVPLVRTPRTLPQDPGAGPRSTR